MEYLNGNGGTHYLSSKYNLGSNSQLRKWIAAYKKYGDEGLKRSRKKETLCSRVISINRDFISRFGNTRRHNQSKHDCELG